MDAESKQNENNPSHSKCIFIEFVRTIRFEEGRDIARAVEQDEGED
jgi:hypothetical protein